jgi:gas vesicle protein
MDKSGFSSFLLGLGVGIGIGMLFAPKAGADTRQLIKDKTGEGTDYLKQRAGEGTDYLKQRGTDIKDSAADLLAKGKDVLNRQKETIADAMEAGKQAYHDAVNQPPKPAAEAH